VLFADRKLRAARTRHESARPPQRQSEKRTPLKQKVAQAEAEIERIGGIIERSTPLRLRWTFHARSKTGAQLGQARRAPPKRAAARGRGMAGGQRARRSGRLGYADV
jgi:SRSO17 transposase